MGKPRLIIIVRHGQSEGNKNRDIHQTVPDHRVKLTHEGWLQAYDAGRRLRAMLRADDTIQFFTSPYQRTRETTRGILQTLTSDDDAPSPFKMSNIKVYEEPRLREQDFGNFQPCSAEMERMWQERADYGHFFYRIPNGESAADAYDRISGFNESLWRQFGDDDFPSVCVLVTHGLMSRVFLMKWYHFSVEYFEDLRNINHCEFLIMRKDGQKYQLETKLRTWSELRRERAALLKEKAEAGTVGAKDTDKDKDTAKLEKAASASAAATPVPTRRWGGCPNGCDHDKDFKIRPGLADLIKRDGTNVYDKDDSSSGSGSGSGNTTEYNRSSNGNGNGNGNNNNNSSAPNKTGPGPGTLQRVSTARRFQQVGYSDDDSDETDDDDDSHAVGGNGAAKDGGHGNSKNGKGTKSAKNGGGGGGGGSGGGGLVPPNIDVQRAWEEMVSSPDATPSFIVRPLPADPSLASPPPPPPPSSLPQPSSLSSSSASPPALAPPKPSPFVHVGRDFGGTYSGHTSDADSSEDDRVRMRMARLKLNVGDSPPEGSDNNTDADVDVGADADAEVEADADNEATVATTTTTETTAAAASNEKSAGTAAKTVSSSSLTAMRRKRAKNMANRLGDCGDPEEEVLRHGHIHDEADDDMAQDLADAEKQDRSVQGSVY